LSRQQKAQGSSVLAEKLRVQLRASEQVARVIKGSLLGLQSELLDDVVGVSPHRVKGSSKPSIDAAIQQAIGKNKEKTNRYQGVQEERHHHLGFEARSQLLLPALDVKLKQNAYKDEGENDESDENHRGNNYQQDGAQGGTGGDKG